MNYKKWDTLVDSDEEEQEQTPVPVADSRSCERAQQAPDERTLVVTGRDTI
jgi:hypothetical protein